MMSSKKLFLKVASKDGERTRKALLEHNLLDTDYKILSEDGMLFIPLVQDVQNELIDTIMKSIIFETGLMKFEPSSQGPKNLTEALERYLSPEEI